MKHSRATAPEFLRYAFILLPVFFYYIWTIWKPALHALPDNQYLTVEVFIFKECLF